MSDSPISRFLVFVTPYIFGISWIYLYGFWSTFDINIFEFIGINDVIKLATFYIVPVGASIVLMYLFYGISIGNLLPPGGGADTKIGRFGFKYWKILVALDILIIMLIINLVPPPRKWNLVIPFIGALSIIPTHLDFFIQLMPNPLFRNIILAILTLIPAFSYSHAKIDSYMITQGKSKYIVDCQQSKINQITSDNIIY